MKLVSWLFATLSVALLAAPAWTFPAVRHAPTPRFHTAAPFNGAYFNHFHPNVAHATATFGYHQQFAGNFAVHFNAGGRFPQAFSASGHVGLGQSASFRLNGPGRGFGVGTARLGGTATVTEHVRFSASGTFRLNSYGHGFGGRTAHVSESATFSAHESVNVSGVVPVHPFHHVPTLHLGYTAERFHSPAGPVASELRTMALERGSLLTPYARGYGNPYSSLYSMMGSGGSAGGGGGGGGSGGGGGGGYTPGPGMGGEGGIEPPMPPEKGDSPVLAALGLPSADGRLDWPLAFRLLPRDGDAAVWQQQIDTLLPAAMAQAGDGQLNAGTVAEIARSLDRLSELLRSRGANLPANTAAEAHTFLQRVGESLKLLR